LTVKSAVKLAVAKLLVLLKELNSLWNEWQPSSIRDLL